MGYALGEDSNEKITVYDIPGVGDPELPLETLLIEVVTKIDP